jgi:hypothetical protein
MRQRPPEAFNSAWWTSNSRNALATFAYARATVCRWRARASDFCSEVRPSRARETTVLRARLFFRQIPLTAVLQTGSCYKRLESALAHSMIDKMILIVLKSRMPILYIV